MSTVSKGPKRFSPTTIVLILVLLGAVAGASRLVTPPPPGPPVEAKPQPPAIAAAKQAQVDDMKEKEAARTRAEIQSHSGPAAHIPSVEDPHAAHIDNTYFIHHKPGEEGLKQVDTEMKTQTAKFEAYKRRVAESSVKEKTHKPELRLMDQPVAVPAK